MSTLSGGERNRLLLARLFAKPANVLALDEPTNDLDLETLELLEDLLLAYRGHLAASEPRPGVAKQRGERHAGHGGGGRVGEYAGGYDDWVRQRPAAMDGEPPSRSRKRVAVRRPNGLVLLNVRGV